jgi:hypothetical protein
LCVGSIVGINLVSFDLRKKKEDIELAMRKDPVSFDLRKKKDIDLAMRKKYPVVSGQEVGEIKSRPEP